MIRRRRRVLNIPSRLPRVLTFNRYNENFMDLEWTFGWGNDDNTFKKFDYLSLSQGPSDLKYLKFLSENYRMFMINKVIVKIDELDWGNYFTSEAMPTDKVARWWVNVGASNMYLRYFHTDVNTTPASPSMLAGVSENYVKRSLRKSYRHVLYPRCKTYISLSADNIAKTLRQMLTMMQARADAADSVLYVGYGPYVPTIGKTSKNMLINHAVHARARIWVKFTCCHQYIDAKTA